MNKQASSIKYFWQRFKMCMSRLFAVVKFLLVTGFVALMLVVSNYAELREVVLSILDEKTVALVKDTANLLYGSSSVLFALEQTACLVAIPAMAILLRSICTISFVKYIILLISCLISRLCQDTKVICRAQSQREFPTQFGSRWLTLCKFIS